MKNYRVKPGSKMNLTRWDPDDASGFKGDKEAAVERLAKLNQQLAALQETLYAEHKHKVLILLQAMDTGGKDGTIRSVFEGINPQGVRVASFKGPTPIELDHDYLWRVHQQVPGRGEIVIFNRSHYEDALIVRVHNLVPPKVWRKRYDHINAFERMLADEGTTILKFFLHISKGEQQKRLQARLDEPNKRWKFNTADLGERKLWPQYMQAYADAIGQTSTGWAPWHVVPANRKWYRNLVVASVIVETLKGLKMRYPKPEADLDQVVII
ncbi:MAG TPA: polyphosphate kinase 2 family protein [Anaerolineae bacterium]